MNQLANSYHFRDQLTFLCRQFFQCFKKIVKAGNSSCWTLMVTKRVVSAKLQYQYRHCSSISKNSNSLSTFLFSKAIKIKPCSCSYALKLGWLNRIPNELTMRSIDWNYILLYSSWAVAWKKGLTIAFFVSSWAVSFSRQCRFVHKIGLFGLH